MRDEEGVRPVLGTMIAAISAEVTTRLQDPEREAAFSRQHLVRTPRLHRKAKNKNVQGPLRPPSASLCAP